MTSKPWLGKSVLIIDDSERVRDELKHVFEAIGMKVTGLAGNGVIGLELVKKLRPDLVSIDIIMPEMDGIECYRKIKALAPDMLCVMISWLASEEKIIDNLRELIPAHLFQSKPVTAYDLEARLRKIYFPEAEKPPAKPPLPAVDAEEPFDDLGIKVS